MKHNWTYKKLDEVCNVSAGQGAPQGDENYCTEGTPFVKAGNIEDLLNGLDENCIQKVTESVAKSHKLKLYKAGSVVFAKSGMSCMKGLVYTLKQDCHVVSHLAVLTPKEVNSSFLNYALKYFKPNKLVKDEAYPSISLSDISNLSIPIPPIEPQSRIVSELDLLQSIIDKQKAQLKQLDNLAQAIFYDMFGDPVENKKGWEVKKMNQICLIKGRIGFRGYTRNDYVDNPSDGAISLSPTNIVDGKMNYDKCSYVTWNKYYESPEIMIYNGDILLVKTGSSYGKCAYVQNLPHEATINPQFVVIKEHNIESRDLTAYLQSEAAQIKYNEFVLGTAIPTFSQKSLGDLPVLVPPSTMQQSFAQKIESIEWQKELINQSIREAQTLFDSRMEYYFGE